MEASFINSTPSISDLYRTGLSTLEVSISFLPLAQALTTPKTRYELAVTQKKLGTDKFYLAYIAHVLDRRYLEEILSYTML